jgi:hypothetical protein
MICSCYAHTILTIGTMVVAAGGLIYAIEVWHREGARRQQRHLRNAVEGEARP